MQEVSATLLTALRANTKATVMVAEFYHEDSVPVFSPDDENCLLRVASVGGVEFLGETYDKLLDNVGKINKRIDKTLSGLSLTLSNSTREIIDFENLYGFEGLICVIREFDRNDSATLDDSIVHFVGRCDPPDEFSKSSESARLNVRQILNQTEMVVPRRKFTVSDPIGRPQSDVEFEGFIYSPRSGAINYTERVKRGGLLGLLGFKKTVSRTQPYSSHSDLQEETCLPIVLGRTQSQMIIFASEDKGTQINYLGFWADGHEYGIKAIENIRSVSEGLTVSSYINKLGKKGGLVDDADHQANDDPAFIVAGIYSRTAHSRAVAAGTTLLEDDNAPTTVAQLLGQVLPIPNIDGGFEALDVSDNAVAQSRWLIMSEYYLGLGASWMDDVANLEAFEYNDHILIDKENTDTVLLGDSQSALAGEVYNIYASTGYVSPSYWKARAWLQSYQESLTQEANYNFYGDIPYNSDDWDGSGVPVLPSSNFRRRFTSNLQLLEEMKVIDFIFDILLPSSNLYLVQNANGKLAHKHRKPVDFTFVKTLSAIDDDEIHLQNINPWVGAETLILIGANLTNSEVRRITDYRYDILVSIAITASGGCSVDHATLQDGTDTVAPNATITISSAVGTKTISIGGFSFSYAPKADDSTISVAGMIAGIINSHNELNKFVKAVNTPNTATIEVTSRVGYLSLDNALELAHQTFIANPTDAPGLADLSGGSLAAGKYQVCYSYVTAEGETLTSPISEITIAANHKIETPEITLPARVLAVKWYCSVEAGGVRRKLVNINDGSIFEINALPKLDDQLEPVFNSTGEEVHAIALAFTDKAESQSNLTRSNVLKGTFTFPKGGKTSSVNQIKLKFRDASADYKLTTLIVNDYVKQSKSKKKTPLEINGAAIDNEHQARRIANSRLAELSDGNRFYGLSSDNEATLLEEGDVVCITDESGRFINEPCRIEEISIDYSNGYSVVSFTARKYRRYYYDDQIQERLVPLPIVDNNTLNREHKAPSIYLLEDATNTLIKVGVTDYSAAASYRESWLSTDEDFSVPANIQIVNQNSLNTVGNILDNFVNFTRSADPDDLPVFIKSRHSTNGLQFGAWSNVLATSYADDGGLGGGSGEDPPPPGEESGSGDVPPPVPGTTPPVIALTDSDVAYAKLEWTGVTGTGLLRLQKRKAHGFSWNQIASFAFDATPVFEDTDFPFGDGGYSWRLLQDGIATPSNTVSEEIFV